MLSGCLQSATLAPQQVVTGHSNAKHAAMGARVSRPPAHAVARGMQQVSNVLNVQHGQFNGVCLAEESPARTAAAATPTALPGREKQHLQQHLPLTQLHSLELQGQPEQQPQWQQQEQHHHHQQQQQHVQDAVLPLAWGTGLCQQQSTAETQPAMDLEQRHLLLPLEQPHQQQLHQSEDQHPQQQQQHGPAQDTAAHHHTDGAAVGHVADTRAPGGTVQQPILQQCNGHHAQPLQQPVQLQDMEGSSIAVLPLHQQPSQQQESQQQQLEQQPVLQLKIQRFRQRSQQRLAAGLQQQQRAGQISQQQQLKQKQQQSQPQHAQEPLQQHKPHRQPHQSRSGTVQSQQQAHTQHQLRLRQQKPRAPGNSLQVQEIRVANSTQPGKLASALGLWLKQHTTAQHTPKRQQGRQQHQLGSTQQHHFAPGAADTAASVPDVLLCCTSKAALLSALQAVAQASQAASGLQQPFQLLLQPQMAQQSASVDNSCGSHAVSDAGGEVGSSTWVQYLLRLSWSALPPSKQQNQQQSAQQQQQHQCQQQQQQHVQQPARDLQQHSPVESQQQQPEVRSHFLLQCDHLVSPGSSTGTPPGRHKAKKRPAAAQALLGSAAGLSATTGTSNSACSSSSSAGVRVPDTLYHLQWHVSGLLRGSWPTGLCASTPAGALAAVKALVHVRAKLAYAGRDLFVSVQPDSSSSGSSGSLGGSGVVLWAVTVPAPTLHSAAAGAAASAATLPLTEQRLKEHRRHRQSLKQQHGPLQVAVQQQQQQDLQLGQQQPVQSAVEQKPNAVLQHSSMQSPLLPPDLLRANGSAAGVMLGGAANGGAPVNLQQQAAVANGKHNSYAEQALSAVAPEQLQPLC